MVGGKAAVDALLDHPEVRAISFVGSTPVAKYVYARGAANGKRVQCQGGAKNHVVVMPDADLDMTAKIVGDSAFGCAGQRCLAVSVAIAVGEASKAFTEKIAAIASNLRVGNGLDEHTQMGPVISPASKSRIELLITQGLSAGGKAIVDGRNAVVSNGHSGNFLKPTILSNISRENKPKSAYGNAASIFTSNGNGARKFRYEIPTGNVGINIGVAAPMAHSASV